MKASKTAAAAAAAASAASASAVAATAAASASSLGASGNHKEESVKMVENLFSVIKESKPDLKEAADLNAAEQTAVVISGEKKE